MNSYGLYGNNYDNIAFLTLFKKYYDIECMFIANDIMGVN